ncbi:MAG: hypothetical protein LBV69_00495 [Bacteroidales bacterium]|jgi:hypothetical protein|nr:hypothetical protein [Bacteroidales bacterium]
MLVEIFMFFGCNNDNFQNEEPVNKNSGKEYYPLKIGDTLIYQVTKISTDVPSDYYDTINYLLKEVVTSSYIDNEGDDSYRLERYIKQENKNWEIYQVWSAKIKDDKAEKNEENQRIIKIKFPISINKKWNGNILNNLDNKIFYISNFNHSYSLNNENYSNCLTIIQDSLSSIINQDFECEIYAADIGLIYKEMTHINSQIINPIIDIGMRISTSQVYKQTLIKY